MKTVCKQNSCCGCGACVQICNKQAINLVDSMETLNAVICEDNCIDCGACIKVCPVNNKLQMKTPIQWVQGWAKDNNIRKNSASGGFATAISKKFIENGGYVCCCVQKNGDFIYKIIDNLNDLCSIAGSKYVKSNTLNTYKEIKTILRNEKKVLFIGLPCHVAGLLNYIDVSLHGNLYTVDLICHGTPSIKLLCKRLEEKHYEINQVGKIQFRINNKFRVYCDEKSLSNPALLDSYLFTFLRGMNYTYNCYECLYAGSKRISDITIGDSWGSSLGDNEMKDGISLALCQTEKGKSLIEQADLYLFPVEIENAINNNAQLKHPMKLSSKRKKFFKYINNDTTYSAAAYRADIIVGIRQLIKYILIKGWRDV